MLRRVGSGYSATPPTGERSYADLVERRSDEPPGSYRWRRVDQRNLALQTTTDLLSIATDLDRSEEDLAEGAPRPNPEARIVPRL